MTMDQQNKTYPAKTAQQMQDLTIDWAKRAGFFDTTTAAIQLAKFKEEHEEVIYAVKGYNRDLKMSDIDANDLAFMSAATDSEANDYWLEKIKDGVGDSMVTYFIQCELRGLTPEITDPECLRAMSEYYKFNSTNLIDCLESVLYTATQSEKESSVIVGYRTATVFALALGHLYGLTPEECFDHAYAIINSRVGKGKTVNGVFVKEEDL